MKLLIIDLYFISLICLGLPPVDYDMLWHADTWKEFFEGLKTSIYSEQRQKSVSTQTKQCPEVHPSSHGNRYGNEEIRTATTVLYGSKRTFNFLRNNCHLRLPTARTVRRRTSFFKCAPGLKSEHFLLLKKTIDANPLNRDIIVAFDEMDIKAKLSYNMRLKQLFRANKVNINTGCLVRNTQMQASFTSF